MREQVEAALQAIRQCLQRDGGDVELIEVSPDGVVKLRAVGKCVCPFSMSLLQAGIENQLRQRVPTVTRVVTVR
jgi:Fe-S cluster biogenesis protein NfuA